MLGVCSLIGLASCEDKNEVVINPGAEDGTLTFALHTPAKEFYVLTEDSAESVMDLFTCDRPDYGFTAATTYSVQVSLKPEFKQDEMITLATTGTNEQVQVIVREINKAVNQLHSDAGTEVEENPQPLYLRMLAVISDATAGPMDPTPIVKPIYSNVISINVQPYAMILKPAAPATYFIIGLADGKWNASESGIGSSLIPLSLVQGTTYDPQTGAGEFEYTGYFEASRGFKLIGTPEDWNNAWNEQWGSADGSITSLVRNDGGSQNINVPTDGFYTITLNSVTHKMKMVPAEKAPQSVEWIELIGDYNDWSNDTYRLTPVDATNPYTWYGEITFKQDGGCKFRADGSWDINWGGDSFPFGDKISGGNIPVVAGTYKVVFNHANGCYFFYPIK